MVRLRDGRSKEMTEMVSVFENGDVYFERDGKFVQAQKWVKAALARKLAAATPATIETIQQG